jgi:hypothetical protein
MAGAEFYTFATNGSFYNGYINAASGENSQPLTVTTSTLNSAPLIQYMAGELTVLFSRKWGATDEQHVSLAAADGLFVLAALAPNNRFSSQHQRVNRFLVPNRVALFSAGGNPAPSPAATTPTPKATQPPTPKATAPPTPKGTAPAPSGANPCATKATVSNAVRILFESEEAVDVAWTIDCPKNTIDFTVSGNSLGWLAMGLHSVPESMDGLDTYQSDGSLPNGVRNGKGDGTDIVEESKITNKESIRLGDFLSFTFQRPLAGDGTMFDLAFGKPVYIYAAMRNASADLTLKHLAKTRGWTPTPLELFCDKKDGCVPAGKSTTTAATVTPAVVGPAGTNPCADANTKSFGNQVSVPLGNGKVDVSYNVSCVDKTIEFNVTGPTKGWLAIAFNDNAKMPNLDSYQMGQKDGKFVVRNGHAEGRSLVEDAVISEGVSGQLANGVLNCVFKRPLMAASNKDRSITFEKPLFLIAASADGADFEQKHSLTAASGAAVQLFSTSAPPAQPPASKSGAIMQLVHGIMMLLAWLALATPSMFIARFLKDLGRPWYVLHRGMLSAVLLLTVVAFAIITAERVINGANYTSPHSYIGVIITILTIAQVVLGVAANRLWSPDRSGTPVFPDMVHWWLGRTLLVAGAGNCGWGIVLFASGFNAGFYIYIVYVVLLIAFVIAGQIVIGAVHHNADSGPGKTHLMPRWRNLTFVVIAIGVAVSIAAAVVAGIAKL